MGPWHRDRTKLRMRTNIGAYETVVTYCRYQPLRSIIDDHHKVVNHGPLTTAHQPPADNHHPLQRLCLEQSGWQSLTLTIVSMRTIKVLVSALVSTNPRIAIDNEWHYSESNRATYSGIVDFHRLPQYSYWLLSSYSDINTISYCLVLVCLVCW